MCICVSILHKIMSAPVIWTPVDLLRYLQENRVACEMGLYYVLHIAKLRNKNALQRLLPALGQWHSPSETFELTTLPHSVFYRMLLDMLFYWPNYCDVAVSVFLIVMFKMN